MTKKIRVAELFAGVGGFRLGLEGWDGKSASTGYKDDLESNFEVVWSNQFEPSTKVQHASDLYIKHFGSDNHTNIDITGYPLDGIPVHDLLVGGFPCQDYSVAKGYKATGISGKKGALWWEIHRILEQKENPPQYLFLENVDRLRNNPHDERGRDFAIVLTSLADLGYIVEWRVINAAEYGMPQRRKRIYLIAFHESTKLGKEFLNNSTPQEWVSAEGVLAKTFPLEFAKGEKINDFEVFGTKEELSENFQLNGLRIDPETRLDPRPLSLGKARSPFLNAGLIHKRKIYTGQCKAKYDDHKQVLNDIIFSNGSVPREYYISTEALEAWKKAKGSKSIERTHAQTGFTYQYQEGAVTFPDSLTSPARTIVTGEGGAGASRFKHVIIHPDTDEYRRLTPVEIERLNMFPDDFTKGVAETRRAFLMGNSVIVGVIEKIGKELARRIEQCQ